MLRRTRETGDFVVGSLIAVMVAGLIYVGVLLLNQAEKPDDVTFVEGAVRLSQPEKAQSIEPVKQKLQQETKPPEQLPKTFSSKARPKSVKPQMNLAAPSLSADIHPSMQGGISMPAMDLGGMGFNMDEVDEVPQILRSVSPEYPYRAKQHHIEGEVVVRMLVTADGTPTHLTIHSATTPGMFDKPALNAAKRWRFRPGRYKGKAVDTWVLLPFNFKVKQ